MTRLRPLDIIALGFMTIALFIGAGNIIFPPIVAQQAGENVWWAATGFLITAVGLPVLTIVALSRVQGSFEQLSAPLGKYAGLLLAIACYLFVGPLFATPRTATVSYEIGMSHYFDTDTTALMLYSVFYFVIVTIVSLYPNKLLDSIGLILGPLKMLSLLILGASAFVVVTGSIHAPIDNYIHSPISEGFVNGYLTMDTLGALVFGIVIIRAIQSRGVTHHQLLTKYACYAGLFAGVGLAIIYISLFKLGMGSHDLAPQASNGALILHAYVNHVFGSTGTLFLTILITLACLVTAIGLTCACAEYFSKISKLPYKLWVFILVISSLLISNLGLTQLIKVSVPMLSVIYPPAIVVILLSFATPFFKQSRRVFIPTTLVALIFGIFDGLTVAGFQNLVPSFIQQLPFAAQNLAWLLPALIVLILSVFYDQAQKA